MIHFSGAAPDALPYVFVTAVGTGKQFKLTSWSVSNAQFQPLLNSASFTGFDVQLHKPNVGRILVSAARRNDGNLWLTSWQVNQDGSLVNLQSCGYGKNEGVTVGSYDIAGRLISHIIAEIVTPVVDQNNQVRLVTWHVDNNGNIVGKQGGMFLNGGTQTGAGAVPSVSRQRDNEYVVNFINSNGRLSWQYWAVDNAGVPTPLGDRATHRNIRGNTPNLTVSASDVVALPLTASGQTTATLGTGGTTPSQLPLQLITWEHTPTPLGNILIYNSPNFISTNPLD